MPWSSDSSVKFHGFPGAWGMVVNFFSDFDGDGSKAIVTIFEGINIHERALSGYRLGARLTLMFGLSRVGH